MEYISTERAPGALGSYSQAVVAGEFVFTSGQIGLDPASMEVVEEGIAAQTDRVLQNLAAVLRAANSDLNRVLKTTVYLTDMGDFGAMNEVYARHFGNHRPARATVAVQALSKDVLVEIDAVALRG